MGKKSFNLYFSFAFGAVSVLSFMSPAASQSLAYLDSHYAYQEAARNYEIERLVSGQKRVKIGSSYLNSQDLKSFYQKNGFQNYWLKANKPTDNARKVAAILGRADQDGLSPTKYNAAVIDKILSEPNEYEMQLELLLSNGLIEFIRDLRIGQVDPTLLDGELSDPDFTFDYVDAAYQVALSKAPEQKVKQFRPTHPHYNAMRAALVRYIDLSVNKQWPVIASTGATLRAGDYSPEIETIRRRLAIESYITGAFPENASYYDTEMERAVKDFQANNGLISDGIIGKATRQKLADGLGDKIISLSINLERLRWIPWQIEDKYLWVNVPSYQLFGVENGATTLQMPVIVGRKSRPTPIFKDQVEYLEINPTWNVPNSIVRKDLYRKLVEDPSFLESENFVVRDGWGAAASEYKYWEIDWSALTPRQVSNYRFTQMPGPLNALGSVKFMFPNKNNVYLHDTNQRSKFNRDIRTISSGCVRVAEPWLLAEFLLPPEQGFTSEDWEYPLASGQQTIVRLRKHVPVYLSYQTVMINSEGRPVFYEDIYGHDETLRAALHSSLKKNHDIAVNLLQ